jgi:arginyl-tRNA synthetase
MKAAKRQGRYIKMSDFENRIREAAKAAVKETYGIDTDDDMVVVEIPKDPKMGDYSTSIAMRLAKTLHKAPMAIAEPLIEVLKKDLPEASSVEVAKPGFINFRIARDELSKVINTVIESGDSYGHNNTGNGTEGTCRVGQCKPYWEAALRACQKCSMGRCDLPTV